MNTGSAEKTDVEEYAVTISIGTYLQLVKGTHAPECTCRSHERHIG